MIQPNELRIGNWVHDENNTPRQIAYIGETIGLHNSAGGTNKYQENPIISGNINDLNYIRLTEEILLKCGFECIEKDASGGDWRHSKYKWLFGFFSYSTFKYMAFTELKYLHQLQNLYFALTGKELEINLQTLPTKINNNEKIRN